MNPLRLLMRGLLGRRRPRNTGTVVVPGTRESVLIRRDRFGIPHIEAANDADAWYALGFAQGQDRAFQIEVLLRVVRGTTAALIGPDGVPIDRISRRIGFKRNGEAVLVLLDDEQRAVVEAFVAGVNAGIRLGLPRKPHEFVLLRGDPTPYEPSDVAALLGLQAFSLAANWDVELARLLILEHDGAEALAALDPSYPEWHPVTSPLDTEAGPAMDTLSRDLAALQSASGFGSGGSNNWALAAGKTVTGRPLLANDPHLAPNLPPYWYLAHLKTPEWAIAGAAFAGSPGFLVAHNGFAAWGVTAGQVDNTDLFLEDIGPDGRSVRQSGDFVECEVRREVIAVRGGKSVTEDVVITPRGPIISPALEEDLPALSLAGTWLDPDRASGLPLLHRVRSFAEFREAWRDWAGPSLNMVYADVTGAIGWQLVGIVPRRRGSSGVLPMPGWDPDSWWRAEPLAYEELPHIVDPPSGFIATANNQPTKNGHPYLGVDWLDGYRVARIREVLADRDDWDVVACLGLQLDTASLAWREIREAVLGAGEREGTTTAHRLLTEWDGTVAADSAAASVFELFLAEMARRLVLAKAPHTAEWALGKGFSVLTPMSFFVVRRTGHLVRMLNEQPPRWFARSWSEEIGDALAEVEALLRSRFGDDPDEWQWGRIRPLTLKHPVGERRPLDRVFNLGPFPWGGDANTVSQNAASPLDPTEEPAFAIAAMRAVIDVGDWEQSRFILPSGQSGNPFSPHYRDQLQQWQQGDGIPIAWSEENVAASTHTVLELQPDGRKA